MRLYSAPRALALFIGASLLSCTESPTSPLAVKRASLSVSDVSGPAVVISQVYGGGGNSGAQYQNKFVELFNRGTATASLAGFSIQYAAATGTGNFAANGVVALSGSIDPGKYFLVQVGPTGANGGPLPTPDVINAGSSPNPAAAAGKLIVANTTTGLACNGGSTPCSEAQRAQIVDLVGYGSANFFEGSGAAPTLSNTTAAFRQGAGCQDTNQNAADFTAAAPAPRNSASPAHACDTEPPAPVLTSIDVTETSVVVGESVQLTASAKDQNGNPMSPQPTFTWSVEHSNILEVDASTGMATGKAAGSTTVTATSGSVSGSATITVIASDATDVLISQIYGGGGNSGAQFSNDFIELFNRGAQPINVTGWAVQYASAAGTSWQVTTLSGTIQPGHYYLVQEAAGAGTPGALPTPDASGTINMSATAGKVALTKTNAALSGACPSGSAIADRVGFGTNDTDNGCGTAWGARTANLSNTTAAFRRNDGCVNTGISGNDFTVLAPLPRNSSSAQKDCTQPPRPPSAAKIAINELMGDPVNAENASWGQWFEVYNYGSTAIDLQGWTIVSQGTNQPDHRISAHVMVPAGGYAVLGRGADIARNGGIILDYNYFVGTATTIWLDDIDFLMLVDDAGARVDSVAWTSLPHGVTKALRTGSASLPHPDVNGASWAYSTTTFGDGDYGTPGASNDPLADTPPFVSANKISVSGRVATDAPLPVGFESQLFATETDASNNVVTTTFAWTSLTPSIASVDERGVIRALSDGTARFRVTAADGASRIHSLVMEAPVASPTAQYGNNIEFGAPTPNSDGEAVGGYRPTDDFIVRRRQFSAAWNGSRHIPNWVAYDLNATHIVAGQDRCNCFTFDPLVSAAGFPSYNTADYTGAGAFAGYGIDRGHQTRSFDRTAGTLDNAVTFYLSNVVPQAADLNQGPWAMLEDSLGNLARFANKEVYIYVGASGSKGTVKDESRITIPKYSWKVALVLPRGKGLADVRDYRDVNDVIAVVMPNEPGVRNVNWVTSYQVHVDSVERLSGYHLLGALPANIQRALKTDTQPPIAKTDGPYSGWQGSPISMSGAASLDPNGTIVSYSWDFGDGGVASGSAVSHKYALPGNYSVRLVVTDNDGLRDTTFTTAGVISSLQAANSVIAVLNQLIADGKVSAADAGTLMGQLDNAKKQIEKDKKTTSSTVALLTDALKELDKMIKKGAISAADAAELRALINRLIQSYQP